MVLKVVIHSRTFYTRTRKLKKKKKTEEYHTTIHQTESTTSGNRDTANVNCILQVSIYVMKATNCNQKVTLFCHVKSKHAEPKMCILTMLINIKHSTQ
jgi:hypothetical protein